MTNAYKAAAALIADSQDWDKIARGDYTPELHTALTAAADDWTDSNEGCDYWGEDDNGGWRVDLKAADLDTIASDAAALGILVHHEADESVTIRPDGSDAPGCEGDVVITADGEAHEAGGSWPWTGTLRAYMAERTATRNWA